MKTTFIASLAAAAMLACAGASAGVLGFDDLAGDESAIPAGYGGFQWINVGAVTGSRYAGSGYDAGVVSPANVAYNLYGATASISRAGAFDFTGAWFTSAFVDQELAFEGWRDGQLLYATNVATTIDTTTPQWIELDWAGIDTLAIYDSSGTQWAMDDFTTADAAAVPEPASLSLCGIALGGLLAVRRRSRWSPT